MIVIQEGAPRRKILLSDELKAHEDLVHQKEIRSRFDQFLAFITEIDSKDPNAVVESFSIHDIAPYCTEAELQELRKEYERESRQIVYGLVKVVRFQIDSECKVGIRVEYIPTFDVSAV